MDLFSLSLAVALGVSLSELNPGECTDDQRQKKEKEEEREEKT